MTRPDSGPRDRGHRLTDGRRTRIDPDRHRTTDLESVEQLAASPDGDESHRSGQNGTPTFDTGTTIVAVAAADAVVMAADQRMSLGGRFTANKNVRKVEQVHPTAAMAISGTVGPAQNLVQSLRAETTLYESRRAEPMSMRALSRTAGHLVRGLPVAPVLAGVDDTGGHVFELDASGSVLADDYTAGGSGMQVAYGVLERRVETDQADEAGASGGGLGRSVEAATDAATAAVEAANERDTASGDGITVATITDEGVDVVDEPETDDGSSEVA